MVSIPELPEVSPFSHCQNIAYRREDGCESVKLIRITIDSDQYKAGYRRASFL